MTHSIHTLFGLALLRLFLSNITFATEIKTINFSRGRILPSSFKKIRQLDESDLEFSLLDADVAVAIDFGETFYTYAENSDYTSPMVILEISSNETGFNADNSSLSPFGYFDCHPSYCSQDNALVKYENTWFSTSANRISVNTSISIGEGAWELKSSALYFKNFSYFYDGYSPEIYGWIGLGTGSGANMNFQSQDPIFSILLNSTNKGAGSLMFGFNSSIADLDNPLTVVNSDENWKMQLTSLSFGSVAYSNNTNPTPIFFDLMISGIVLPERIFNALISQMSTYNMTCFDGGCESDNITGLPSLVFGLAGGQNFSLSPESLMDEVVPIDNSTTFYFSMGMRYHSHPAIQENNIILGWDVLANFYTLFQQKDGANTISFYEINSASPPSPNSNPSDLKHLIIIIGASLTFGLVCVCIGVVIVKKRKSQKRNRIQEKLLLETELNVSTYSDISEPQERYCML